MNKKVVFFLIVLVVISFCSDLSAEVRRRVPKLNYDCSIEIPMTSVYPPELYDNNSDGIYHIDVQIRTNKRKRKPYTYTVTKTWPILENNTRTFVNKLRVGNLKIRKARGRRIYRPSLLKMFGPLKKNIRAKYKVFNSELLIGGACASCSRFVNGNCRKVTE